MVKSARTRREAPAPIPGIPDTPENIAKAVMLGPPEEEWRYLKESSSRPETKRERREGGA